MERVHFGNVILVGSRAAELAAATEAFAKTPAGIEVGKMGAEAGRRTRLLLSGGPQGELRPYVGHEAEHKEAAKQSGKEDFDRLSKLL